MLYNHLSLKGEDNSKNQEWQADREDNYGK